MPTNAYTKYCSCQVVHSHLPWLALFMVLVIREGEGREEGWDFCHIPTVIYTSTWLIRVLHDKYIQANMTSTCNTLCNHVLYVCNSTYVTYKYMLYMYCNQFITRLIPVLRPSS